MKIKIVIRKYSLAFFVQLLIVTSVFATEDPVVKHLGIENGLSNNAVTCIYQDQDGFMWFGTYDGLNRYDGYSFKVFRNSIGNIATLSDNHIYTINGDKNRNIWVGTAKGISIYNPSGAKFYSPLFKSWNGSVTRPIDDPVHVIRRIGEMDMIVGTQSNGLIVFEKNSGVGFQVALPVLGKAEGNYVVSAAEYDSVRQLAWVFVEQVGLCQYNIRTKSLQVINSQFKEANCIKIDKTGAIWLGTDKGLYQYEIQKNSFSNNYMPGRLNVLAVLQDEENKLWISTDGSGVWQLPANTNLPKPYLAADGSPLVNSNAVYDIYADVQGRKWVGTLRGGINIIEPRTSLFKLFTCKTTGRYSIIDNFILSFQEDDSKDIWIGTDGAGLKKWDRVQNKFIQYVYDPASKNSISSNFITSITKDLNSDIWFSTWFGGISRLKKGTNYFEHFNCFNPKKKEEENNVWLIYEDKLKTLWASTTNEGTLYTFNRITGKFELFDDIISNIQCLAEDRSGSFWGGNYNSLIRIDRTQKQHHVYNIGYPVRCIHEDKNKNFWVGTEGGGLLLFDRVKGVFKRFTTGDGLPSNTILRLLEDKQFNLWLSTYNGLCKFNTLTKTGKNFSQSDGLQSNQFSFNAALELTTGEFMFGGIKGFNTFYPDSIWDRAELPPVFLTGLRINNITAGEDSMYRVKTKLGRITEITLPFDKGIISLEFLALQYSGADKIQYAYMLEGWEKEWNYVNNTRTANYSRLQEGIYNFKIKVTNADGTWSKETQLVKIRVLPPWYRSWWAYLLYAVSFFSIVYLYISYNKRQERLRYEIKLAHLENDEEKKVTERKISFFTHISHEFRTPLTLIINPLKEMVAGNSDKNDQEDLIMVYRNARRLLSLVDQLLLFRKVDSLDRQMRVECFDIRELCNEVFLSFGQHAIAKQICFTFEQPAEEIYLYADKEKIEIILFNLVSNAFKYTSPGFKIALRIEEEENNIRIIVKDSGKGIPAEIGNKIFDSFYRVNKSDSVSTTGFGIGLHVSQSLAKAHFGNLSYTSQLNCGSEFCLQLLKGKDHFPDYEISDSLTQRDTILQELLEEQLPGIVSADQIQQNKSGVIDKLTSALPVMAIVDDSVEIRTYLNRIFCGTFKIYEADDGESGFELIAKEIPDIVISDIMMKNTGGIELCRKLKQTSFLAHIPVILLTASSSTDFKLKGLEGGAEDYITKPFEKEIITARVRNILKSRSRLQQYFFNTVTLRPNAAVAGEHSEFIERCIAVVEKYLDDPDFNIQLFCRDIGMSHGSLYKKVKSVSGLTLNVFIRYLRLRKAAELLINTNKTILEITYETGFNDTRYFREQFHKLFEMNPSEYIKRYRKSLGAKHATL